MLAILYYAVLNNRMMAYATTAALSPAARSTVTEAAPRNGTPLLFAPLRIDGWGLPATLKRRNDIPQHAAAARQAKNDPGQTDQGGVIVKILGDAAADTAAFYRFRISYAVFSRYMPSCFLLLGHFSPRYNVYGFLDLLRSRCQFCWLSRRRSG